MNAFDTARFFKALSEPPRIAILHILSEHPDMLTVDKLIEKLHAAGFPLEQPTFSHHLKILRRAGMVTYRHHWHHHYYSVCPDAFAAMAEALCPFMAEVEVAV